MVRGVKGSSSNMRICYNNHVKNMLNSGFYRLVKIELELAYTSRGYFLALHIEEFLSVRVYYSRLFEFHEINKMFDQVIADYKQPKSVRSQINGL